MSVFEKINKLNSANARIRSALTDKGVDATGHGAEDFATDIANMPPTFDPDDYAFVIYKENDEYKRRYEYIGKTVTTLASNHFDEKNNIVSVILPSTITSLGEYCFRNCTNLESVNFENITELGNLSLSFCNNLLELNCPNVTTIATKVFNQGYTTPFSLTRVVLPKIQTVPGDCFRNLNSKGFTELRYADISSATVISGNAFKDCWNLTTVKLGNEVKTIGGGAFGGTAISGELDFPKLESLGADAFLNTKITKVHDLGSITYLYYAFGGCSKLTFLRIPSTVVTLDNTVVYGTYDSSVTVICMPDTPPEYKWNSLSGASVVYVPDESVDAYKAASGWSAIASKIHPLSEYTGSD